MFVLADTEKLTQDGVISSAAANEIITRSRATMVTLSINMVLCFGILAATGGLIFWLANAISVALVGAMFLGGGLFVLARVPETYRMLGNAAALIGSGMLMGGAAAELLEKYEDSAGPVMLVGGAIVAIIAGRALWRGGLTARFVAGSIFLMGIAMHLFGIGHVLDRADITGWPFSAYFLYCAAVLVAAGWLTNVRFVTALAIAPFAQALDVATGYSSAVYMFFSPEPTLSILQMSLLIAAVFWFIKDQPERIARHGRTLVIIAFVVANLCALVGSLWGDVVGETLWGSGRPRYGAEYDDYDAFLAAKQAYLDSFALNISANVYSVLWAIALVAIIAWAAHRVNRGLFNAGVTFAGIHAYTQLFESFADEPLAWVIGGFAAIPLAWGMWRLNQKWVQTEQSRGQS